MQIEKSKGAQAIIDRDQHHVAARHDEFAVVGSDTASAVDETAAMNPDQNRALRSIASWGLDIEIETILRARSGRTAEHRAGRAFHLWSDVAETRCVARAGPGFRRLGQVPAQVPDRRFREGNAVESEHPIPGNALELALCDLDGRGENLVHPIPQLGYPGQPKMGDISSARHPEGAPKLNRKLTAREH